MIDLKKLSELRKKINELRQEQKQYERDDNEISTFRLKGMELEKSRDIDEAISAFSKCIEIGESKGDKFFHSYSFAYERIIIDLHKTKQYYREAYYIREYLKHDLRDKDRDKYQNRLEKLKVKL